MDISGCSIWQVAAGDGERCYGDLCLQWDVILNGPGSAGPWPACAEILRRDWGLSARKMADIRCFAEDLQDGDFAILRVGTTDVLGFGVIVGDYQWNAAFHDVVGWDLQHVRRVRWLWTYDGTPRAFPAYTLKPGLTTQAMDAPAVFAWIAGLRVNQHALERPLRPLPPPSDGLGSQGVSG